MKKTHKILVASIAALCLAAPGAAFAQSSSVEGYSEPRAEIEGSATSNDPSDRSGGGGGGGEVEASGGSLPFTGLDLGLMVAGGIALAGTGFGMRRLTRRPDLA